jgi:hypothetical protein
VSPHDGGCRDRINKGASPGLGPLRERAAGIARDSGETREWLDALSAVQELVSQ